MFAETRADPNLELPPAQHPESGPPARTGVPRGCASSPAGGIRFSAPGWGRTSGWASPECASGCRAPSSAASAREFCGATANRSVYVRCHSRAIEARNFRNNAPATAEGSAGWHPRLWSQWRSLSWASKAPQRLESVPEAS